MAKFLLLIALIAVVYFLYRGFRRDVTAQARQNTAQHRPAPAPEDMVRCLVCGVHLPRSESFTSRGKFFCSDEHRRLDVREAGK